MLSIILNTLNRSTLNALVKMSTIRISAYKYINSSFPFVTWFLRKWNFVSMCLFYPCAIGFLARIRDDSSTYNYAHFL